MTVLTIIGVIAFIIAVFFGLLWFDDYCEKRFDHRFLSKATLVAITVASGFFYVGLWWYEDAVKDQGDVLNGLLLMGIASLIGGFLVVQNFRKTTIIYGLAGSALQLGYASIFGAAGAFIAVLALAALFVGPMIPRPLPQNQIWIVNNRTY